MSQHDIARQIGNAVRSSRSVIRARIVEAGGDGMHRRTVTGKAAMLAAAADELERSPIELASLPLWRFFGWFVNDQRLRTALILRAGIASELRPIGDLTERQRQALSDALRSYYAGDERLAA